MQSPAGSSRLLWGLLAVLAAWGVYLAIGATGVFTDAGLFDARRSLIVLACSASFLGFWSWILVRSRRNSAAPLETSLAAPLNLPSVMSTCCIAAAYALWTAAWVAWARGNPANLTFVLGWISVALFATAAVMALIGLSDPRRDRAKLWGLLTLGLLLVACVGLIIQVRHFANSQRGTSPQVQCAPARQAPMSQPR